MLYCINQSQKSGFELVNDTEQTRGAAAGDHRFQCRFCGTVGAFETLQVPEMYFGTGESFSYRQCQACASLVIAQFPDNLASYYPSGYGGHVGLVAAPAPTTRWRRHLLQARSQWLLGHRTLTGWVAAHLKPDHAPYPWVWLRAAGAQVSSRLLDVGCGSGGLLRELQAAGFDHLSGIDAFAPVLIDEPNLKISRGDAMDARGAHDIIMMHHSLEHMEDASAVLLHLASLLRKDGALLIRIPVAAGMAQQMYGAHWYQIDAPRHLAIPSLAGMRAFISRLGLHLDGVLFDSTASQFYVSEGYSLGLSMKAQQAQHFDHVGDEQMKSFERLAEDANRLQTGDQATFIIRRPRAG